MMPGHRFEHLAGAHHRPRVELRGRDRALAGRRRDADEVLRRVLDVGDVAERAGSGHDDVGAERQRQHDVGVSPTRRRHAHGPAQHAEVEQPKCELGGAGRDRIELVRPASSVVASARVDSTTRSMVTPGSAAPV